MALIHTPSIVWKCRVHPTSKDASLHQPTMYRVGITEPFLSINKLKTHGKQREKVVASARTHAALHLQPPCCHFHHENPMNIHDQVVPFQAFLSKGLPKLTMTSSPEEN